jgi:hypothetical protein
MLSSSQVSRGTATCRTCFRQGIKLTACGKLYHHGPHTQPCPGSGQIGDAPLTRSFPPQDQASSRSDSTELPVPGRDSRPDDIPQVEQSSSGIVSDTSSSTNDALLELSQAFSQDLPAMIKWIPRSARTQCSAGLRSSLLGVKNNPASLLAWKKLLLFGRSVLIKPTGNKKTSLGSLMTQKCKSYVDGNLSCSPTDPVVSTTRRNKVRAGQNQSTKDSEWLRTAVAKKLE